MDIDRTQFEQSEMHHDVNGITTALRKHQADSHNKRTNDQKNIFTVECFVLVRRAVAGGDSLSFFWQVLRRVVGAKSELVYQIKILVSEKIGTAH